MKLPCSGCGISVRVTFWTWWFYAIGGQSFYPHLACLEAIEDQRRLDGI